MNTTKNNICCFFGHGDVSVNIIPMLKEEIEKLITEKTLQSFKQAAMATLTSLQTLL